ncbi:T9SS type A sorting domain-containing protein [Flaviaesturariibacter flavus]|uniref:T9SS type A sorting domain-containing protein n=1 Tax=Flaviaesturariibacter flavus TaxID=2502780 RepID=A0A4R1BJL2_9BACT|nr:collagen-binding domain-containing protein [Flaviaesturariibacter flavus]TCJ17520.1 T9SS type A sorting domain-containing protein [Flaviaesturariibacter flavus]
MPKLLRIAGIAVACLYISYPGFAQTFAPTASALNFNTFMRTTLTAVSGSIQGPSATGTDLLLNGTFAVSTSSTGKYPTNTNNSNSNYSLAIGGRIFYNSGGLSTLGGGNFRITNGTGTRVWYTNTSGNPTNTKLTTAAGTFGSTPAIQAGQQQTAGTVLGSTGIDFNSAFDNFIDYNSRISSWKNSTDSRLNKITLAAGNNPHITLVSNKINYLNLSSARLTSLASTNLHLDNRPAANRILVINVDVAGSYTWTPTQIPSFSSSDGAYVIWNFYTTSSLAINGTRVVAGTVFAPTAAINLTNTDGVLGQVIGQSLSLTSSVIRYLPFTSTLSDVPEAIILPLRSIQLRGMRNGNTVELLWDVIDEVDIASYTVERSSNGTDFSRIGEVRSSGDHARYTYQFQDLQPELASPTIFYRIQVLENNGTRYYSKVKSLQTALRPRWEGWPNPVQSELNLSFDAVTAGHAQLRLVNMAGQVLLKQDLTTRTGFNLVTLRNLGGLLPGSYFVEIRNEKNERLGSSMVIK